MVAGDVWPLSMAKHFCIKIITFFEKLIRGRQFAMASGDGRLLTVAKHFFIEIITFFDKVNSWPTFTQAQFTQGNVSQFDMHVSEASAKGWGK